MSDAIRLAAKRLHQARLTLKPGDTITDMLDRMDIDAAYQVQNILTENRVANGAKRIGRKIGLTSFAVQQQIGVDRPDFGVLFDDMPYASGQPIPEGILIQPKVEAEVAFVLKADITEKVDSESVKAAVDYAVAALEVVDSRIRDWKISLADTVADNASSGVYVLGDNKVSLDDFDTKGVQMRILKDGEVVSEGSGVDCLGDPLAALAWLANTSIEVGDPLRAGEVVLSGALGPMVAAFPGESFTAEVEPLGAVTAVFGKGE